MFEGQFCEEDFMKWLSGKVSSAQLSELYWCYKDIENASSAAGVLKAPLFETTDLAAVGRVREYVEKNRMFRMRHLKSFSKYVAAMRHYCEYIQEQEIKKVPHEEKRAVVFASDDEVAFTEPIAEATAAPLTRTPEDEKADADQEQLTIDFMNPGNLTGTEPCYFSYFEESREPCSDWTELYVTFFATLEEDYPHVFSAGMSLSPDGRRVELESRDRMYRMAAPKPVLGTDYAIETDLGEAGIVQNMKHILDLCSVDYENVLIKYRRCGVKEEAIGNDKNIRDEKMQYASRRIDGFTFYNHLVGEKLLICKDYNHFLGENQICKDYASAVGNSERFAKQHHFKHSTLYTADLAEAKATADELFSNDEFVKLDERRHHQRREAINKLLEFIDGGCVKTVEIGKSGSSNPMRQMEETRQNAHKQPSTRILWEKQEAVILLDAYLRVKRNEIRRTDAVREVSRMLRQRAVNLGMEIDDKFRNEHGINAQMTRMGDLYERDLSKMNSTGKLFFDTINLYKTDYAEFNRILEQGKAECRGSRRVANVTRNDRDAEISTNNIAPIPCERYRNKPYEEVLRAKYKKGFRLGSTIADGKFRRDYKEINGAEINANDGEIESIIKKLCIQCDGLAYLPDTMLGGEPKNKLFEYIEKSFDSGKSVIYYKALCNEFSDDFLDYPVYNKPDALKAYLGAMADGRFYVNRSMISREPNATADPLEEIRECLKEAGRPMKYEEIFEALPHLPQDKIKNLMNANSEFISNGRKSYFHESIVQLSDEELEDIAGIIEAAIDDRDFISGDELYGSVRAKYPYIIENNAVLSVKGFRNALRHRLEDRFSFEGDVISRKGEELSVSKIIGDFASARSEFTLSELKAYTEGFGTRVFLGYAKPVFDNSVRVDEEHFVSKDSIHFPIDEMDETLGLLCGKDYMAISDVDNFSFFPYVGYSWNPYLLTNYVMKYSKKYMLLQAAFQERSCAGAIVKRTAGIENFDDLVVRVMVDENVELKKEPVLDRLVEDGYLARRAYSNIENLIIRARAQMTEKGTF